MRKALAALATAGIVAASGFAMAQPAAAASYGTVDCGWKHVTGIWISQGSNSGWASWYQTSSTRANWSYNLNGNSYRVHVGCGGSPQSWETVNYGPWVSPSKTNFVCNPSWRNCYVI